MGFDRWFYKLPLRVRSLFGRRKVEQELDAEIRYHLERLIEQNIAARMTPEEARYAALRAMGGIEQRKEECRDMRSVNLIQNVLQDLRYAGRMLRKSPGFTAVAILSLALGIGANTAIFQLVDALRIRSLPVVSPEQLAEIRRVDNSNSRGQFNGRFSAFTNPLWEKIRDQQQAFAGAFVWGDERFDLTKGGEKRFAEGLWVSGELFQVLGVRPVLGRLFTSAGDKRGCTNSGAVISYGFWQREFGQDPAALEKVLTLDGHPFQIIGVTSASFFGVEPGRNFDVAVPICAAATMAKDLDRRDHWWLSAMGRLKPGWSIAQANVHLQAISPQLFQETLPANYPPESAKSYLSYKLGAYSAASGVSSLGVQYAVPLWLLLATAGLVLLITCANLANLLLARGNGRQREVAVRLALGASRGRLVCQFLMESVLLSLLGAISGALLARLLARSLVTFLSTGNDPLFLNLSVDWPVLAFLTGLTALTCILFGLIPAVRATRTAPIAAMKSGGRGLAGSRERLGLRRALVVSQVALSLVLLVSALLFTRTLVNLITADAGFNAGGVYDVRVDFGRFTHLAEQRPELFRQVLERLRSADGVASAAEARIVPITGGGWNEFVRAGGNTKPAIAWFNAVSDGYFKTMDSRILAGRDFTEQDTSSSEKVAIANETFAQQFLNGASPIGTRVQVEAGPGEPAPAYEIVGLVKDAKYRRLREPPPATIFVSARQENQGLSRSFVVRSSASLPVMTTSAAQVLRDISPDIAFDVLVLSNRIRESLRQEQLMATVSGFFGLLAVILAIIGIYGILAYMVAQRGNEIGIRMALGANRSQVVRMILGEAALLVGIGLFLGTLFSILAAGLTERMLFGIRPNDPITIGLAVAALALVSAMASYLPARRAANVEPMRALREE
jgi:predicted permease